MSNNKAETPDGAGRELGTIGETTVYLEAEGPKAQWCVDVLSSKFEGIFEAVKQQVQVDE